MEFFTVFLFLISFAIPSIAAHKANQTESVGGAQIFLRVTLSFYLLICLIATPFMAKGGAVIPALLSLAFASALMFKQVRAVLSVILTSLNRVVSGSIFLKKTASSEVAADPHSFQEARMLKQVLLPKSMPHMNGLLLYIMVLLITCLQIKPEQLFNPSLGDSMPMPRSIDFAFFSSFITTLIVVAVGVGIFITRKPKEVLYRLGLVKPGWKEFAYGAAACVLTFLYDYACSLFTHDPAQAEAFSSVMGGYNQGTYGGGSGGLAGAVGLASVIGLSAGIEEEICMRGALQPVLGIIPSAFFHAALHLQFSQAPLFILQIFVWSALMGILKHYTNTTTTLIAHTLFNFISCFLIAFNP